MQTSCGICKDRKSNYTCPRCNMLYCSLKCYRALEHQKCSEGFYKACVEEELKDESQQRISKQKMQEILERVYENNEGLDSDDCSDTEELSARLTGVDLDSPEEIWAKLSAKERKEFESILNDAGKINELIPDWQPWWIGQGTDEVPETMPQVCEQIPLLSTIMKKKPSEAVGFGLGNILFGYAVVARLFLQDWALNAKEAVKALLDITHDLNKCKTWGNTLEAVNDAAQHARELNILSSPEQCEQAKSDTAEIMKSQLFVLAAISDLSHLFKVAFKLDPTLKKEHFPLLKKLEFYLSYVKEYGDFVILPSN